MELTWHESYLILILRITVPFFRKRGFGICSLEYAHVDGDYIVYSSEIRRLKIRLIYNPQFDVLVEQRRPMGQSRVISLVKEKNKYTEYRDLPENVRTVTELESAIMGYLEFLNEYYLG